jgi:hypothetical protein
MACAKSQNHECFWDFVYETTYETNQKLTLVEYLGLSCNKINNFLSQKCMAYETLLAVIYLSLKGRF